MTDAEIDRLKSFLKDGVLGPGESLAGRLDKASARFFGGGEARGAANKRGWVEEGKGNPTVAPLPSVSVFDPPPSSSRRLAASLPPPFLLVVFLRRSSAPRSAASTAPTSSW